MSASFNKNDYLEILLGAGGFSNKTPQEVEELKFFKFVETDDISGQLNVLERYGLNRIDTARIYGLGTSEVVLKDLKYEERGFVVDTKVKHGAPLTEQNVLESIETSKSSLGTKQINILYLHAPDITTPIEETLKAINIEYKKNSFKEFGLSNFTVKQIEEIFDISRKNGYVLPTVYQGVYNLVSRNNEPELLPFLRKNGIRFIAWSPLAGGFFNIKRDQIVPGSRYDPSYAVGGMYSNWYFKESLFTSLQKINRISQDNKISNVELALRWLFFHSQLKREHGDGVILGASRPDQLISNLESIRKGPLPTNVVNQLESIWQDVKTDAPAYHF